LYGFLGILSQYGYGGYVDYEVEVTLHPLMLRVLKSVAATIFKECRTIAEIVKNMVTEQIYI
jgi:hypothetical protein